MATPDLQDANILDQESINWRLIIYPIVAVAIAVVAIFAVYSYLQIQRENQEADAHQAIVAAKTPQELAAVADKFPNTSQATLALLAAADLSFSKDDYNGAIQQYQRVIDNPKTDPILGDSARLGLAAAQEVLNKLDDAANNYLVVARRGNATPYSPYAYSAAARIYQQKNDTTQERAILTEATGLTVDSPFTKNAQDVLKSLNAASQSTNAPSATPPPVPEGAASVIQTPGSSTSTGITP